MSLKYTEYNKLNLSEIASQIIELWDQEKTFEESLYFDGISNLLGYRRIGALVLGQLDQGIIYQRVALTAVKIFLYICFPELILFSLIGKSICHCLKLQVLEGKNKASDLASGSWKLEEKHGKVWSAR